MRFKKSQLHLGVCESIELQHYYENSLNFLPERKTGQEIKLVPTSPVAETAKKNNSATMEHRNMDFLAQQESSSRLPLQPFQQPSLLAGNNIERVPTVQKLNTQYVDIVRQINRASTIPQLDKIMHQHPLLGFPANVTLKQNTSFDNAKKLLTEIARTASEAVLK